MFCFQEEINVCGCQDEDLCNVDITCPTYCEFTTLSTTPTTTEPLTPTQTMTTTQTLPSTTSGNCKKNSKRVFWSFIESLLFQPVHLYNAKFVDKMVFAMVLRTMDK